MTRSGTSRSSRDASNFGTAERATAAPTLLDGIDWLSMGLDGDKLASLSKEGQHIVSVILAGFQAIMMRKSQEVADLQRTVKVMHDRIEKLEEIVDNNSSYERRDTLVISGDIPPAKENENCATIVSELVREQLSLNLKREDISTAHRIGRKPLPGKVDKRGIIFKLCRRDIKRDILFACREQKPKYYINEHLTPIRNTILYALRKAKAKHPVKVSSCRSVDGNVTVYL